MIFIEATTTTSLCVGGKQLTSPPISLEKLTLGGLPPSRIVNKPPSFTMHMLKARAEPDGLAAKERSAAKPQPNEAAAKERAL